MTPVEQHVGSKEDVEIGEVDAVLLRFVAV